MKKLHRMRREYDSGALQEHEMAADPMEMFARWLEEAIAGGIDEPNAMTLATATMDGKPSARVVLLKEMTAHGFAFFTNYLSRKGRELLRWCSTGIRWHDRYASREGWNYSHPKSRMLTTSHDRRTRVSGHGHRLRAES